MIATNPSFFLIKKQFKVPINVPCMHGQQKNEAQRKVANYFDTDLIYFFLLSICISKYIVWEREAVIQAMCFLTVPNIYYWSVGKCFFVSTLSPC